MNDEQLGRLAGTVEAYGGRLTKLETDFTNSTNAVHQRINGIFKIGLGMAAALALNLLLLLLTLATVYMKQAAR